MEKPTLRTVGVSIGHSLTKIPMKFYNPEEMDSYIAYLEQRAEAAEATVKRQERLIMAWAETRSQQTAASEKLADLEKQEVTGWRAIQNGNRDLRDPLYLDGCSQPTGFKSDYAPVYSSPAPGVSTVELVPLKWSEECQPVEHIRYHHILAVSPLGRFSVEWKGWKDHDSRVLYLDGEYIDSFCCIEDAKKGADLYLLKIYNALTGKI